MYEIHGKNYNSFKNIIFANVPLSEDLRSGKENMKTKSFKQIRSLIVCSLFWVIGLIPIGVRAYAETRETYIADEYVQYATEIGEQYNIAPELIVAMIERESSGKWNVISDNGSIGLMQINPKYHTERMEKLGVTDIFNPYNNILVGVDYLSELANKYEDLPTVLMCYNMGEYGNAIEKAGRFEWSDYAKDIMQRNEILQK